MIQPETIYDQTHQIAMLVMQKPLGSYPTVVSVPVFAHSVVFGSRKTLERTMETCAIGMYL